MSTAMGGREPRALVAPGSAPEEAPAGHGTAVGWVPASGRSVSRLRPDLLVRSQKPGIIPLSQLRLGIALDGALRLLRRNPGPTMGLAFVVGALFTLPVLALTTAADTLRLLAEPDLALAGLVAQSLAHLGALTLLSGLVAVVTHAAVLGRRVSAGACWGAVRPRLLPLLGTVGLVLLAVIGGTAVFYGPTVALAFSIEGNGGLALIILGGMLATLLAAWLTVRLLFAATICTLEGLNPARSVARSWQLTRGFSTQMSLLGWGLTGGLLCLVGLSAAWAGIMGAGAILFSLLLVDVSLPAWVRDWADLVAPTLSGLLSLALAAPYLCGLSTLAYLNRRFVLEGYDVTLVRRFQDEAGRAGR